MEALKQVYQFIEAYHAAHHYQPTIEEIRKAFGITHGQAHYRLEQMEARGWIKRDGRKRSIVLLGMKSETLKSIQTNLN